ncbi:MAG: phosphoenolpyruvate synthase [Halobacteriovoraceae bacterium]|nr:phosphoenolpyruvate synthase [Halobacteriovoraceae bacterium]
MKRYKNQKAEVSMLVEFKDITLEDTYLGGKAQMLGILYQRDFTVPKGMVLTSQPKTKDDFDKIEKWWQDNSYCKLAIRSSAKSEDSKDFSFAGQNSTFLDITEKSALEAAIKSCFNSKDKHSSKAYRKHFLGSEIEAGMNVVIQRMLTPKYSGVFFSKDPRGESDEWILELIEGLGEDLVSGKVTPKSFSKNNEDQWHNIIDDVDLVMEVANTGLKVKESLGYEVDMEWAVEDGCLYVLQARPITSLRSQSYRKNLSRIELARLKKEFDPQTIWDGQTFAEWTGRPTHMTFKLWQKAFSPHNAFGDALHKLGYISFNDKKEAHKKSLLDKVFGAAYVNLDLMSSLYFGPIPYRIIPLPRPHLKFDWQKINLETILKTPYTIFKMVQVGWNLSTNRKKLLSNCRKELNKFKVHMSRPMEPDLFDDWSDKQLINRFQKEYHNFAKHTLHCPFILIILTESSLSSLTTIISSIKGKEETQVILKRWMSIGLKTTTMEMGNYFKRSCAYKEKQAFFMSRYGHRAAGELELSNPRWIEIGDDAFYRLEKEDYLKYKMKSKETSKQVLSEIEALNSFKVPIIKQEWGLLKEMLELREQWKMELLKPYAHIRFLALEIGKRLGIGNDIFWLDEKEISQLTGLTLKSLTDETLDLIKTRKEEREAFKKFSLPQIISLSELENVILNKDATFLKKSIKGEALSPGLAQGVVKVVTDINSVDLDNIEENTILVAEATDPGWTPLFTKVNGIVVAKGGVLSHCAIVAREMELPAVSGINNCHLNFKDGDKIWVDGNNGRVNLQ